MSARLIVRILIVLIAILLFAYTSIRASLLSFTHDESFTYLHFASQPFHAIFAYNGLSPSNNHLINSIMMKLSSFLLGTNEFSCRLPNLFAHLLYLLASFLIVDRFHNHWISLCGFVILNVNPFLLDFFGLARGYGLGLGFMMCGIYSFLRSLDASSPDVKRSFLTSFYMAIATLSNLTFLNIFLAVTGILFCSNFVKLYFLERNVHRSSVERLLILLHSLVPILSVYIMFATFIVLPIIKLQRLHDFYIGGRLGFWSDTVGTLIASSLYEQNYFGPGGTEYLAKIIWMIVFLSVPLFLYQVLKLKYQLKSLFRLSILISVWLAGLSTVIQHYWFGTPFLAERTGIFFIPLFSLIFINLIDGLFDIENTMLSWISKIILVLLTLSIVVHITKTLNFTYTLTWKYDSSTKNMLEYLKRDYQVSYKNHSNVCIGIDWIFDATINFYRITKHFTWLEEATREGLDRDCDYYYYMEWDTLQMMDRNIAIIQKYSISNTIFARGVRNTRREK